MGGETGMMILREALDGGITYRSLVRGRTSKRISWSRRLETAGARCAVATPALASGIESIMEEVSCRCPPASSPARSYRPAKIS